MDNDAKIPAEIYFALSEMNRDADAAGHFYKAFLDTIHIIDEFQELLDRKLIFYIDQRYHPEHTEEWRRQFPESHYAITDEGRKVLDIPSMYVEPVQRPE